jgi:hypothetical protein
VLSKYEEALFQFGAVVMMPGARDLMKQLGLDPAHYLARHVTGDWGDLSTDDKKENDYSVTRSLRIFLAYGTGDSKLRIITEADRSVTTIPRPDEY